MATANELFASNGEDYIVIDSDLRTMTFPASVNNIGVENDKDVHKLNFKMPRYFSGYDLSEFIIHINYVNANGDADMYYVLDPTIEENEIKFSWLVGRHACLYRGSVTFIVCLKLADGEGDVAQEYNTTLASLQVLPGLETEPTILETEHDIIEQLLLSINDTNAKIKAVLDTGLTPEQIAEFYDKSKTYDTQIAALNGRTLPWGSYNNVKYIVADDVSFDGIASIIQDIIANTNNRQTWISLRVNASSSAPKVEPFYGSSFNIMVSCSSTSYGWGWLQSDNGTNQVYFGRLSDNWTWYKVGKQDDIDVLNSRTNVNVIYTDTQVTELGGVNAAIADAVAQKKFPENVAFSGMIQIKSRYHIDGYIYSGYKFGSIWLHKFNNDALFVSITGGSVSISKLPTRAEVDALNNKTAVAVTAGENVTIDVNKSYAVGKMLFLSVKGHASADVTNAELFTISGVTLNPTEYTFFCGVGAEWSLTGIGYCYVNANKVVGRITSGQYFHICVTIPIN